MRTLQSFFSVLGLRLSAGATTVAEAAFQDRLWRPGLATLHGLTQIRIVHWMAAPDVALARRLRSGDEDPLRRAHADSQAHKRGGARTGPRRGRPRLGRHLTDRGRYHPMAISLRSTRSWRSSTAEAAEQADRSRIRMPAAKSDLTTDRTPGRSNWPPTAGCHRGMLLSRGHVINHDLVPV